jgi:hypothetical protein
MTYIEENDFMLLIIGAILFIVWILGLTAFHVAGGFIHLLVVLAVISLIMHFVRGRSAV